MVHEKKKEAILSWVRSAGGHDVQCLSDLADGKFLYELAINLLDDTNLSSRVDNEIERTDSACFSKDAIADKKHLELTQEASTTSVEIQSNTKEQLTVNGYHDSINDEVKLNGETNHSEELTEGNSNSGNEVLIDTISSSLSGEIAVTSQDDNKDEDTTDYVLNGTVEGIVDCSFSDLRVTKSVFNENSNSLTSSESTPLADVASEVERNYNVSQKFIENMLEQNVSDLVEITRSKRGNKDEITKLHYMFLSAMVQYSISTKKDHIMAPCLSLSVEVQEEIMDCLELFLKDRSSPVERKEFHARLARCAKRISPRKQVNVVSTPHSTKPLRRGRNRKVFNNNQEEFLHKEFESPIQNLINSPDIRHITPNSEAKLLEAVKCRDKKIAKLTYDLDEEKYNVDDLKKQVEGLNLQLSKLKKENDKIKKEFDEVQTHLENNEIEFEKDKEKWKNEAKDYKKEIKDLKDSEKLLKDQMKPDCSCSEVIPTLRCTLEGRENRIRELLGENEILKLQVEKLDQERQDLAINLQKLEENVSSDMKASLEQNPTEKYFNITDLSKRDELRDKVEDLKNCLMEKEAELMETIQKLNDKAKVEREWKARFRKTDKEREDAINRQKKLEVENSNLNGQLEVFKRIYPSATSQLPPGASTSSSTDRRSLRSQSVHNSEQIAPLWNTETSSNSPAPSRSEVTQTEVAPDRPSSEATLTEMAPDRPFSESTPLNNEVSENSSLNRPRGSQSLTTSELSDSITTCELCSLSDISEVPPLVQNICKLVKEDCVLDEDALLKLQRYEKDFKLNELVEMLVLLTRALKEKNSSSGALKRKRGSGANGSPENVKLPKTNNQEALAERSRVNSTVSGERSLDATNDVQQQYNFEKKKVACLQIRLKKAEEKLKKLQVQLSETKELSDTNLQRCKSVITKYELIKQELYKMKHQIAKEKPQPVIQTIIQKVPPPPCEICPNLKQKLDLVERDFKSKLESLKKTLTVVERDNEKLKQENCKLFEEKNELEEKLSDPTLVGTSVYSPRLKTIRDKLMESSYADIKKIADGSGEMEANDNSSFANSSFSFMVPSTERLTHSNRNRLTHVFCKAEDEAEMLSQSSISETQSGTPKNRLYELNRRNTLCLPHLKSQYPLEYDMTPSQHKYYQLPPPPSRDGQSSSHSAKKRKLSKPSSEKFRSSVASLISSSRPSTSGFRIHPSSTPKVKKSFTQSMHNINTSVARLQFRRSKSLKDE